MREHSRQPGPEQAPRPRIDFVGKALGDEVLVSDHAEKVADELLADKGRSALTSAQLRRFFHDFRALEAQAGNTEEGFKRMLPRLKMMRAKIAYAYRQGGTDARVPKSFHDFIDQNVRQINTLSDFRRFMLYFEAVVGFCYGKGIREGR